MDPLNPSHDPSPAPNAVPGATPPGGFDPAGVQPPVWSVPAMPVPPPVVSSPVKAGSGKRRRDPLTLVMFAAAFVAVGGVGFATGRVTAPAAAVTPGGGRFPNGGNFPTGSFNPGGGNGGGIGGGRGGFGGVSLQGTVTEVAADHITIKLANGSTLSIPVDSSTTYHSQAAASAGDVKSGVTVQVQLSVGTGAGGPATNPNPSAAPGGNGFGGNLGTASDITIVGR